MTERDNGSPDRSTQPAPRDSPASAAFRDLLREVARTPSAAAFKRQGDTLGDGRYRVERLLGKGGQKVVFVVHDTVLHRDCALSLIDPEQVASEQLERFRHEARVLARMGAHPNIVTIYDLGEDDGLPYLLCEYVEGGDLRGVIAADEALPSDRALRVARDVCRALACAHARGVVHRDVTPGNVWLLPDGAAKLGDFGLALVSDQTRVTRTDSVLGTAAYIAPEQARGEPADARSDLYSLGCVLYELLTGAPPFVADSALAVVAQHLHAEPKLPAGERIAPQVSELVLRLLAKTPEERPASAGHLLAELDRLIAASSPAPAASARPPLPDNEPSRLAALHELEILDTPPEIVYDELVEMAARLCDCPMAYIAFVDETRQWMKARFGIGVEFAAAPREVGVCQTTICQSDVLVAPDLSADERFRDLPPVVGPPYLRFYCGAPLLDERGQALGTLCVMDVEPRTFDFEQIETMRRLARQALAHIELRTTRTRLAASDEALERARVDGERARRGAALLHDILPPRVAAELVERNKVAPRFHQDVTLGVVTFVDYDQRVAATQPAQLVETLDAFVSAFDAVARRHRLEKLRSVAGSYYFVAGLGERPSHHALDACLGALALRAAAEALNAERAQRGDAPWQLRVGLHSGPAMSGVIGRWKYSYDVWGSSTTDAARVEASGAPGDITLSESTYQRVNALFSCRPCGSVAIADRGSLPTYALERIRDELSADDDGTTPSARFFEAASGRGRTG